MHGNRFRPLRWLLRDILFQLGLPNNRRLPFGAAGFEEFGEGSGGGVAVIDVAVAAEGVGNVAVSK